MVKMKEKYLKLRETVYIAWTKYYLNPTATTKMQYDIAYQNYTNFCTEILEKLMSENNDILIRLKN